LTCDGGEALLDFTHRGLGLLLVKQELIDELPEFLQPRFLLRRNGDGNARLDISYGAGERIRPVREVSWQVCRDGLRGDCFEAPQGLLDPRQRFVGAGRGLFTIKSDFRLGLALLNLNLFDQLPEFIKLGLLVGRKRQNALLDYLKRHGSFVTIGAVACMVLFRWHSLHPYLA
jgi:hypothetical protein